MKAQAKSDENTAETIAGLLGAVWLGLFPLWNDLSYSHITHGKWVGMWILAGVTALTVLTMLCLPRLRAQLARGRGVLAARVAALCYFALVALSACTGTLSATFNAEEQPVVWMGAIRYEGLATQLAYASIFLLMTAFRPRLRPVLNAAAGAVLVFCLVVALQYAGLNPLGLFPEGLSVRTNYEFQGTIGNIDMISGYLTLVVPLTLFAFVRQERGGALLAAGGLMGWLLMTAIEVQAGLMALSLALFLLALLGLGRPESRARVCLTLGCAALLLLLRRLTALPWLDGTDDIVFPAAWDAGQTALLAGAVLCLGLSAFFRRRPGKAPRAGVVPAAGAAAAVAFVAAVVLLPVPQSAGGLWELHETLLGRAQDSFGSYRMGVWRHTLNMSRDRLLTGSGPDTFYYAMQEELARTGETLPETFDNAHNEFLSILSNNGVFALAAYAGLLLTVLGTCLRRLHEHPLHACLAAAIVCYAAQSFFSFSICLVSPMFWAVLGMTAATCGAEAVPAREPDAGTRRPGARMARRRGT